MEQRDARALGILGLVVVAFGFASCGRDSERDVYSSRGGAGGEQPFHAAGSLSEAGRESDAGSAAGGLAAVLGGAGGAGAAGGSTALGGAGGVAGSGEGGGGGDVGACPVKATVACDEIVAGARYDEEASKLTLQLPPGRVEVASASMGVTFTYANGDPEDYADVNAAVAGDTLTFDFSAHSGSGISYLSGEPNIKDTCGDQVRVLAPGAGFGPAVMVQLDGSGGHGGGGGQGGGANSPDIACGHTN